MFNANKIKDELVQWIKDWFESNGNDCNAIIGLSGGKDSLIMCSLLVEALGANRVIGVAMPDNNQGLNDADKIAEHLGIKFIKAPIGQITKGFHLWSDFKWSKQTEQNIPPRVRMTMLYAIAQTFNGRVVGTTNLDERLAGYFTKYGDGLASDVEPIELLTVNELIQIGEIMGLPGKWLHKVPSADIPNTKTDEEELGFSYKDFGDYIRNERNPGLEVIAKINERVSKNAFKLRGIAHFDPKLYNIYDNSI